jgi:hypothetical protein
MLNAMSILNLTIAVAIVVYSAYQVACGRRINRWMMVLNTVAGLWASVMYILFVIDTVWFDIFPPTVIREYCIKPAIFVLLCTILAWSIRSGWRDDR